MIYRQLGSTGLKVSQLGFGGMRLPMCGQGNQQRVDRELAIPMIHRAFEAGVNYIDTAVGYCNYDSQRVVGEALKGWRDKIIVSTKNPYYGKDEKQWWQNLEESLERLGVDHIDIYSHHNITWKKYANYVEPYMSKWMTKARDQGLIGHICCSFHDDNQALMRIIDTGYVRAITLQYNMLYRDLEEGIDHAQKKGIGVVVMGPVGGGALDEPAGVFRTIVPKDKSVPALAIGFVLANPQVSLTLSGMSTLEQVEENIAVASDSKGLSQADRTVIEEHLGRLKKMADLYCTGCGYCMPCAAGVNIPAIFERYNQLRVYGLKDSVQQSYAEMGRWPGNSGLAADGCIQCGVCEKKCPQNIPIRKQLAEAHEALNLQSKPYDTTEISGQLGIEKLQQQDVAALYRFYSSLSGNIIRAHRPYSWWISEKLLREGPFERLSAGDEYAMVIGDQAGNIWGHAFVEGLGSPKPSFAVGVHQRLLGCGWGRKLAQTLLKAAEDELELEQIDAKVLASNTAGVELCRSMGFQVTGEYIDKDDGLSYLQMQKTIARQ